MESLRPYREGAPASRIHWPTVARVGTLMERRLLADSDSQPLVVVDPTHPSGRSGARHGCARRGVAVRPPGPAAAAVRCSCPATAGRWTSGPTSAAGRPCMRGSRWSSPPRVPPCARLESRRGAIFWVTARAGPPRGPRAPAGRAVPGRPRGRSRRGARSPSPDARAMALGRGRAEGGMSAPRRTLLELAAFAALAWYTAAHWASGLVADAPAGRVFAVRPDRDRRSPSRCCSRDAARGVPGVALRVRMRGCRPRRGIRRGRASTPAPARARALGRARRRARPRLRRARHGRSGRTTARSPGRTPCCCSPCRWC